jgi:hypothetical protein
MKGPVWKSFDEKNVLPIFPTGMPSTVDDQMESVYYTVQCILPVPTLLASLRFTICHHYTSHALSTFIYDGLVEVHVICVVARSLNFKDSQSPAVGWQWGSRCLNLSTYLPIPQILEHSGAMTPPKAGKYTYVNASSIWARQLDG